MTTAPLPGAAIRAALVAIVDQHRDLTEDEAGACMEEIMGEGASAAQVGALMAALRMNGEPVDELTGMARVVRAHANAIKFCYEKELQRKPTLGGKIEAYWVIVADGSVEKSKIAVTTMDDGAVEGCIARQLKQWVFP